MHDVILVAQLLIGLLLITLILLQAKGSGLSAVFGGEGGVYRSRRGVEKILHRGTIFIAASFMLLAIASLIIK